MITSSKTLWIRPLSVPVVALCLMGMTTTSYGDSFIRGDVNEDAVVDVSDAVCLLFYLFVPESPCGDPDCLDALEVNDDGGIDVADSIFGLTWLFMFGPPPPPPGFVCGPDPTEDAVDCRDYDFCEDEFCPVIRLGSMGIHRNSDVAVDGEGNVIVAWESDVDEDGLYQLRAASFTGQGEERYDPFTVNGTSSGQQFNVAIGVDAAGRMVAAWEDDSDNDGVSQIRARAFESDTTERLAQFTVNVDSPGQQGDPDIAVDPAGNFVVVWEDDGNLDGLFEIEARGFNADGTERFAQFTVNDSSAGQQRDPIIAMDAAGNFVIAWEDDGNQDGFDEIEGRAFNADGTERLPQFTVNTRSAGQQTNPAIAMDPQGNFLVSWDDDRDGDGNFQVHARGFHPDGTERVERFTVNFNDSGQQINASLAMNAAGDFVAAYEEDRDNDGEFHIRMRGFRADGTQNFAHAKVDCIEPAQHLRPAVGIDSTGRIFVFWDESTLDPDENPHSPQVLGRVFVGAISSE